MNQANHQPGVTAPGHVVISFPSARHADQAACALSVIGFGVEEVQHYSDREMVEHIDRVCEHAGGPGAVDPKGDPLEAQRRMALSGHHWLVVHAPDAELAVRVAEVAALHGAARAQRQGASG
ncbi:MAG: hypothetical protein V4792_20435 [Pseudomonadota bacterium]